MTAQNLLTRVAVFIILRNNKGQILMHQRANTGYLDGYYDLSCSGHVDAGESIQEAAVRELAEEIGITADPQDLKLVHIYQAFIDTPYLNFTFLLDSWQGTSEIKEPNKCSNLAYFDADNLPERCTLGVRVNERAGFGCELSYSKITKESLQQEWPDLYAELHERLTKADA
ncbi:MAG TPA: NUDIX domain-containing protein [Candidatus Saccharimonadales bacterium]|nr:NUDIX domain-containing protein [Candidatus Saccharimonadales bacterium]